MSDQTLFTTEQSNPSEAAPVDTQALAPTDNGYGTLLQGITTDDGRQKYANVSDALTSIPHKEQHITTLESENSVLREELNAWKAKLEAAERLAPVMNNTTTETPQTETTSPGIDVETLTQQIAANLSAQEQRKVHKERLTDFRNKMVSSYGDKAQEVYKAKLAEKGLSEKLVLDMEAQSPGTAWNFLGLDSKPEETTSVPATTFNSTTTQAQRPDTGFAFRPKGQKRPGMAYAEQRDATLKRLAASKEI